MWAVCAWSQYLKQQHTKMHHTSSERDLAACHSCKTQLSGSHRNAAKVTSAVLHASVSLYQFLWWPNLTISMVHISPEEINLVTHCILIDSSCWTFWLMINISQLILEEWPRWKCRWRSESGLPWSQVVVVRLRIRKHLPISVTWWEPVWCGSLEDEGKDAGETIDKKFGHLL